MWLIRGTKVRKPITRPDDKLVSYWNGISFGARTFAKVYDNRDDAIRDSELRPYDMNKLEVVEAEPDEPLPTQNY